MKKFSPSRPGLFWNLLIALLFGSALGVIDAKAQIYVSTDSPGGVGVYNTSGTAINASLVTGLSGPGQIAVSGSTLYVGNTATGIVGAYNATTGAAINANFITGFRTPNALAVSGTILYVADMGAGTVGEYNAATGAAINASFITGLSSPSWLTLSGSYVYVSNYTSTGFVGEYNAITGQAINADLVTGLDGPCGTILSGTTLIVVNQKSDSVGEYNATTGAAINASFITGLDNPVVAAALSGTSLLVTNQDSNSVGEYNPSTGGTINGSFITGAGLANAISIVSNVTTSSSPAIGGTTTGAGLYSNTSNATVTATAAPGYTFSDWSVNGNVVSSSTSYTFSVTGTANVVANFTGSTPGSLIYVSSDSPGGIGVYSTSGTAVNANLVTGLSGPGEIVVSGSTLYVGNTATGVVGSYSATTGSAINANLITGFQSPNGLAVSGTVLYVADVGTGIVGEYNAATGAAINANFITGLSSPSILTLSGSNLYVTNYTNSGFVGEYNAVTGAAINAQLITGLYQPAGTLLSGTIMYVIVNGSNTIGEYNAVTGSAINASFITGLDHPVFIASLPGNALLVTNQYSDSVGEYNASTGAIINASFITGVGLANSLSVVSNVTTSSSPAIGGTTTGAGLYSNTANATVTATAAPGYTFSDWTVNGNVVSSSTSYTFSVTGTANVVANFTVGGAAQIFVAGDNAGTIGEYDGNGNAINASLVTGLFEPAEVAVSGTTLYVANSNGTTVSEYNAMTGAAINANFITGLSSPNGLLVNGNVLYVTNLGTGIVGTYNATTGAAINADFITGLTYPGGLYLSGSTLYVSNSVSSTGSVGEYNAVTGAAINTALITGLNYPTGMALSGTDLLVENAASNEVGEYNASTGAVISGTFITTGDHPANMILSGSDLYVTNQNSDAVGEYNAVTGAVINASLINNITYCNGIAVTYTVSATASPAGAGSITGGGYYSNGNIVTVTEAANPGYTFNNWTLNGSVVSTSTSYTFTANYGGSVVATFSGTGTATASLIVASDPIDGGTVAGGGSFPVGSLQQISATPSSGWSFIGWSDGVTTNPRTVSVPAGGAVYVGNFIEQSATESASLSVVSDPDGAGFVTGSGIYTIGSSQEISATPFSGWLFTGWSDGVTTNPRSVTVPVGGATYVADFAQSAVLNVVAGPSDGGTVTGNGTYAVGTFLDISATAYPGWIFTGWSDGVTENPRTVAVQLGGTTYTADFTVLYYPPAMPVNVTPVNAATNVSAVATLAASPFSDPDPNATQIASEWVVKQISDNTVVQDVTEDSGELTYLPGVFLSSSTSYLWQVRYEDSHGLWSPFSTQTLFTTAAHIYRPDEAIGFSVSALLGTDVYGSDGQGETLSTTLARAHSKTSLIFVENDGNVSDTMVFKGDPGNSQFAVHYYNGTSDVSKAVIAGTLKVHNLHPGQRHEIRALVKPSKTALSGAVLALHITVSSGSDPGASDTVVYQVTAQ